MSTSSRISIVTCSFNQAEFLEETIRSVLEQNYPSLEYVVVDGGSNDGSVRIISRYADKFAYWVSEPDQGQAHALAKGFDHSTGEIMGWVNSDDTLVPGALAAVSGFFRQHPDVDVVYGDANLVGRDGQFLKSKREIEFDLGVLLWDYDYIPQPSTFWRRGIWERSGGLDMKIQCAMDYDLWLKFAKADAHFEHLPVALSNMRFYPEQKNRRLRSVSNREDDIVRERFLGRRISRAERARKKVWHKVRRVVKRLAIGAYRTGRATGPALEGSVSL